MDLKKERMMILDMIAEGKITAAEGEELFKALGDETPEDEARDSLPPISHVSPVYPVSPVAPVSPVTPASSRRGTGR